LSQLYSFPIGLNASWHHRIGDKQPTPNVHDWLFNTGSLTEKLQALATNFSVELIGQQPVSPQTGVALYIDEISALPDCQSFAWQVREVVLYGDGKPWVFARSILPDNLCNTAWSTLGNQPLGQRIFNDNSFVRSDFVISQLNYNPINPASDAQTLWARRSMFSIQQYNLLVAEVFLPDCPCYQGLA